MARQARSGLRRPAHAALTRGTSGATTAVLSSSPALACDIEVSTGSSTSAASRQRTWGISRFALYGALLTAGLVAGAFALVIALRGGATHPGSRTTGLHPALASGQSAAPGATTAGDLLGSGKVSAGGESAHAGSGKGSARGDGTAASAPAGARAHGQPGAAAIVTPGAGGAATVAEVRDPEESKSFPLPASVRHRAASTPSVAAEAVVAPGAASDAEIRRELHEEARAKAQEQALDTRALHADTSYGGSSVGGNGTIPIPANVPEAVQRVIAGGNAIADFPYIWGGGHGSFVAHGYDCSGSVSYALAAGGLLSTTMVSGELANWGAPGPGRWITIYANAGHVFMNVDGMWFDTAGRSGPYASRWILSTPSLVGYAVRHPPGY